MNKGALFWTALVAMWLACIGAGMKILWDYQAAPGKSASAPTTWPIESTIPRSGTKPLLVMMVHPRCPCSRASMSELLLLMDRLRDRVEAYVVFVKPEGTEEDFTVTDLFHRASAIPGVTVRVDDRGVEAERFHAWTSGQTFLYDVHGALVFAGGITSARGHEGENTGLDRIVSLVKTGVSDRPTSAVYGCPLQDPG